MSKLAPVGNFKEVLESVTIGWGDKIIAKCNEEGAYRPSLAEWIKTCVGKFDFGGTLEEGIKTGDCWDVDEAKQCLLFFYYNFIKINYTAHYYLNPGVDIPTPEEQFRDYVRDKKDVFGDINIVE